MSSKEWFNDYYDSVYSYIFLQVGDRQTAEDLTQETFIKVVKKAHKFRGDSLVQTWIFRIAYTTTMSYFRKKSPITYYFDMKSHSNFQPSAEEAVLLNFQERNFYEALYRLKKDYQQVIILRKIQGLSTKEVASILSWSEGKVKMGLSRALTAFKKELEKGGFTGETLIR